jgi:hypothetical protein
MGDHLKLSTLTNLPKQDLVRPRLVPSRTILWMGIFAAVPYGWLFLDFAICSYSPHKIGSLLSILILLSCYSIFILLIICIFSGFTFGLTGIIKGVRNVKQLQPGEKISLAAIFGISLSVIGVLANLWYFIFYIPSVLAVL